MIKAGFFDFDGVLALEANGREAICTALAKQFGIPYELLEPIYKTHTEEMNLKPIPYSAIISPLNKELDSSITVEDILGAAKTARPNQGMLDLAKRLRQSGLITGIITDNKTERIEILREPFGLDDFEPIVISAKERCTKWQDSRIFERALVAAGVAADEALFIDNTATNLSFAADLGIHTYLHNDATNDLEALDRWVAGLVAR